MKQLCLFSRVVTHILKPPFQVHPPFLAGLDQGTPLTEAPGLAALRAGHRVFIHHTEVLVQSLWCRGLLNRGMLQAGGEEKYFSLEFDLAGASHQIHTNWVSGLLLPKPR